MRAAREAREPAPPAEGEESLISGPVLEEWEIRELLRLLYLGHTIEERYLRGVAECIADRVLESERLRRKFVKGDWDSKVDFVRSDGEAYSEALAVMVEWLRETGVEFIALPVGVNDYKHYYTVNSCLHEGADAKLLRLAGQLFGPCRRGRISTARSLLLQLSDVRTWEELNPGGHIALADEKILDVSSLRVRDRVAGKFFTVKAGVALDQGDLDMLRSWLGKYSWEEGEDLIFNIAPNYAKAYLNVFHTQELRAQAREMLGSILFEGVLRKAWIVVGDPGIGKSVVADALKWALGDLATSISLERLFGRENRLVTGELAGKYANITSESPAQMLRNVEFFKQITGDEVLYGEVKYRRPFRFRNRCKLITFANELPLFSHMDDAVLERLYVIESYGRPPERPDPSLRLRIRERELKYVLMHVLWCYKELEEREFRLEHAPSKEYVSQLIVRTASTISDFVEECCEIGEYFREAGKVLYETYLRYCREHGITKPLGRNTFYAQLSYMGFKKYVREGIVYFKGLRLRRGEEGSLEAQLYEASRYLES